MTKIYLVFPPQTISEIRSRLLLQITRVIVFLHQKVLVTRFRPPASLSLMLPPADAPALVIARPVTRRRQAGLFLLPPSVAVVPLFPRHGRRKAFVVLSCAVAPLAAVDDVQSVFLTASRFDCKIWNILVWFIFI